MDYDGGWQLINWDLGNGDPGLQFFDEFLSFFLSLNV
jgi:hypothetical protein